MGRLTDWFRRGGGRTLRLPASGKAIILSDLHGHFGDWRAFVESSRVLDRLADGEDLWLLITGDVPDVVRHQAVDPSVPADGDVKIVEDLIKARSDLGERLGRRIVYLEGNHDFHVSRICREVARFHAYKRGRAQPLVDETPAVSGEEYEEYCFYYRDTYGEAVFDNNIGPYDMVGRAQPEHLRFLESGPILAVLEGAGVLVTHAGPARMRGASQREIMRRIDRADRERLRTAAPQEYYDSPYHQLLNNRFRNGDYSLADLEVFLKAYDASVMVTGHTPHPYLVDFERQEPLEHCMFRDGLGMIGARQVVLCTSFGAFHPLWKRYLEVDLTHRYETAEDLFRNGGEAVRPLFTQLESSERPTRALPGAEFILKAEEVQKKE